MLHDTIIPAVSASGIVILQLILHLAIAKLLVLMLFCVDSDTKYK